MATLARRANHVSLATRGYLVLTALASITPCLDVSGAVLRDPVLATAFTPSSGWSCAACWLVYPNRRVLFSDVQVAMVSKTAWR